MYTSPSHVAFQAKGSGSYLWSVRFMDLHLVRGRWMARIETVQRPHLRVDLTLVSHVSVAFENES